MNLKTVNGTSLGLYFPSWSDSRSIDRSHSLACHPPVPDDDKREWMARLTRSWVHRYTIGLTTRVVIEPPGTVERSPCDPEVVGQD